MSSFHLDTDREGITEEISDTALASFVNISMDIGGDFPDNVMQLKELNKALGRDLAEARRDLARESFARKLSKCTVVTFLENLRAADFGSLYEDEYADGYFSDYLKSDLDTTGVFVEKSRTGSSVTSKDPKVIRISSFDVRVLSTPLDLKHMEIEDLKLEHIIMASLFNENPFIYNDFMIFAQDLLKQVRHALYYCYKASIILNETTHFQPCFSLFVKVLLEKLPPSGFTSVFNVTGMKLESKINVFTSKDLISFEEYTLKGKGEVLFTSDEGAPSQEAGGCQKFRQLSATELKLPFCGLRHQSHFHRDQVIGQLMCLASEVCEHVPIASALTDLFAISVVLRDADAHYFISSRVVELRAYILRLLILFLPRSILQDFPSNFPIEEVKLEKVAVTLKNLAKESDPVGSGGRAESGSGGRRGGRGGGGGSGGRGGGGDGGGGSGGRGGGRNSGGSNGDSGGRRGGRGGGRGSGGRGGDRGGGRGGRGAGDGGKSRRSVGISRRGNTGEEQFVIHLDAFDEEEKQIAQRRETEMLANFYARLNGEPEFLSLTADNLHKFRSLQTPNKNQVTDLNVININQDQIQNQNENQSENQSNQNRLSPTRQAY